MTIQWSARPGLRVRWRSTSPHRYWAHRQEHNWFLWNRTVKWTDTRYMPCVQSVESALKGPNCVSLSTRYNKMCIHALLSLRWQNWEWKMRRCRPALWKTVSWVSLAGSQAKAAASDTCRTQGNKRMRTCVWSSGCQTSGVQWHIVKSQLKPNHVHFNWIKQLPVSNCSVPRALASPAACFQIFWSSVYMVASDLLLN